MIIVAVYIIRNWLEPIHSQGEKSVQFLANYHQQPKISGDSANDTSNKFKKWNTKYNKNWKWTKKEWSNNIFSKFTNDEE